MKTGQTFPAGRSRESHWQEPLIRGINFLILDEGVSAVDVETANEIEQELLDMQNLTLLDITHRIKDGLIICYDRVLYMEKGKLIPFTQ